MLRRGKSGTKSANTRGRASRFLYVAQFKKALVV